MTDDCAIISCEVFRPELRHLTGEQPDRCYFLPQGLHRHPQVLRRTLQGIIDGLDANGRVDTILLAYGLCGNGLDGIRSKKSRLLVPHCEDCIPVLHGLSSFGDPGRIDKTGTYYLSPGWIRYGSDAYREYRRCLSFLDNEEAFWVTREMIKSYSRFALIDTGLDSLEDDRAYARMVAAFFGLDYLEVRGSLDWLAGLLEKPVSDPRYVRAGPGEELTGEMFRRCISMSKLAQ
ncbi:MAG: DUF1638 domain-containing protein [Bacillota bacterium]